MTSRLISVFISTILIGTNITSKGAVAAVTLKKYWHNNEVTNISQKSQHRKVEVHTTSNGAYGSFFTKHMDAAGFRSHERANDVINSGRDRLTPAERKSESQAIFHKDNGYYLGGTWQQPDFPLNGAKKTRGKLSTDFDNLSEEQRARRSVLSMAKFARAGSSIADRTGGVADVLQPHKNGLTINKHTKVAHYADGTPVMYHGAPAGLVVRDSDENVLSVHDNLNDVSEDPKKFVERVFDNPSQEVRKNDGLESGAFFATTDPMNAKKYATPGKVSRIGKEKVGGFIMQMKPDPKAKFAWGPLSGEATNKNAQQLRLAACNPDPDAAEANFRDDMAREVDDYNMRADLLNSGEKGKLILDSGAHGVRDTRTVNEFVFLNREKLPEVVEVYDLDGNVILEDPNKTARHMNNPVPTVVLPGQAAPRRKLRATKQLEPLQKSVTSQLYDHAVKAAEKHKQRMEQARKSKLQQKAWRS